MSTKYQVPSTMCNFLHGKNLLDLVEKNKGNIQTPSTGVVGEADIFHQHAI